MNDRFIHLKHPLFEAKVLKQGAQLIHFQPTHQQRLLWSAKLETFQEGKAFRGGVPICWPWFNKMGTPSHGFARTSLWTLVKHEESEQGVELVFELTDSKETRALWDHSFTLSMHMKLGSSAKLSLHVKAEKESYGALHSYFTCKDVSGVEVQGLGEAYTDSLQDGKPCHQVENSLHVKEAIDRIYTDPTPTSTLYEGENTVTIHHENHSDVVVWNPWKEGTRGIVDMEEDDYLQMLCIETARINKPFDEDDSLHVRIGG